MKKRENTVILCGYEKTGTSWSLFVICNYFNMKNIETAECLLWGRIVQNAGGYKLREKEKRAYLYKFKKGMAPVYYTHTNIHDSPEKKDFFSQFDKLAYTFRNPFDTMISLYHYTVIKGNQRMLLDIVNQGGLHKYKDFDDFIKKGNRLNDYINHVKHNKDKADLVLNYDKLRVDPNDFRKFIGFIVPKVDERKFQKALNISSFENIRKTENEQRKTNLKARDGKSGQYKDVMNMEQIEYIKNKWLKAGLSL